MLWGPMEQDYLFFKPPMKGFKLPPRSGRVIDSAHVQKLASSFGVFRNPLADLSGFCSFGSLAAGIGVVLKFVNDYRDSTGVLLLISQTSTVLCARPSRDNHQTNPDPNAQ